jgi:4-aminobutyrate aminotransferase/(S)-3-amino-2-methylpropionate transaminase
MTTNAELAARRARAVARGVAHATTIYADRAEGAELWDVEGRRYIDFAGGIAVLNTGHRHPAVMAAAAAQMQRYTHTSFQVVPYEPYVALCERLNALAPIEGEAKSVLFTSGAEAIENAVKIARAWTKRSAVIAFVGGYHGRTLLTAGLTGKVAPYKAGFGPFPAELYHVPFPVPHHGVTEDDAFAAIERVFKADVEPERVAAIVIEPVLGEGGFYIASPALLARLRALCDAHGIVLIADEVQTGFGRTGKYFAMEHSGVKPDLIAVAKSLAGGFPLSGVIGRAAIMDAPGPGGLGGTYGGFPVACAAALAVLDVMQAEGLNERSLRLGERAAARLRALRGRPGLAPIGDVRHLGGMIAFELVRRAGSHEPDAEATKRLTQEALALGLILLSCGIHGNVIRILVPLTASDAIVDEGLAIVEQALARVAAPAARAA